MVLLQKLEKESDTGGESEKEDSRGPTELPRGGRGQRKRKHDSSAASTCSEDSERSMDFGKFHAQQV